MYPVLTRNFEIFPALDWLGALTAHIPNQDEHLVRDSGWDRTVSRGKRKQGHEQGQAPGPDGLVEIPPLPCSRALKQRCAQCIKQVSEADPLLCPRGGGSLRIIAFIDQPEVLEAILLHVGRWPGSSHSPPVRRTPDSFGEAAAA